MDNDTSKYRNVIYKISPFLLFLLLILTVSDIYSYGKNRFTFWKLDYVRGTVGLESNYYYLNTKLKRGFIETQKSSQFNGSFSLNTKSTIIHPSFIELEFNALFRPGTRNDNFIVAPDQAAVTTAEKVGFRANIFNQRPISGSFYISYDHSFVRRDFATNIENVKKNIGAFLIFRSYFANVNLNYNYDHWLQNELELNRFYASKIHSFKTEISQAFGKHYTNKLTLNYGNYYRRYSTNNLIISNKTFDGNLNTNFGFNLFVPIKYFSFLSYNNQIGYDRRNRFNINQSLYAQLPFNFQFNAGYNYNYLKVDLFASNIYQLKLKLNHQLFKSLKTFISINLSNYKQNQSDDKTNEFKVGFDYIKLIPYGNVRLSYNYGIYGKSTKSEAISNSVYNEIHKLTDGNIELLNNPDVLKNTVVVTDEKNIIVFQEGFDYEKIDHGSFVEIRRLLGGQIPNKGTVLVNYNYLRNNSYKYNSPNHHFFAGINLFNNLIQLAYSGIEVKYDHLQNVRYVVLKLVSQRIFSLTFNYAGFSTGMELESYKSNIVPYKSKRYFGQYDYLFVNSALLSLIANYKTLYLTFQNERQIFMDAVGRVMFFLNMKTKLLFEGSYRFQEGAGIDLKLLKFKTEFQLNYRAIQVTVGLELYDRTYIQESRKYLNGYVTFRRSI